MTWTLPPRDNASPAGQPGWWAGIAARRRPITGPFTGPLKMIFRRVIAGLMHM